MPDEVFRDKDAGFFIGALPVIFNGSTANPVPE